MPRFRLRRLARRLAVCLVPVLFAAVLAAPRSDADEEWRERAEVAVSYDIRARLRPELEDGDGIRIVGNQRVSWTNTSRDDVSVVYLHLYANAFRNTRSTYLRELARTGWSVPDDMEFGGIELREIQLVNGGDLAPEFVSHDDGNPDDRTVVRIELPEPVAPGATLGLRMKFTTTLPTIVSRMGHKDDFVMAAQWFPKLGRYVGVGSSMPNVHEGWYCHQFHEATEFYADFADYDVELRVPNDAATGATGRRVSFEVDDVGLLRTEQWEARSVVDFAWTSSPRYIEVSRRVKPFQAPAGRLPTDDPVLNERIRVAALLGVEPESITAPPVIVRLLIQPEHERQADRHFEAVRVALGFYTLWLGPYPYDTLTVVDPAHGAREAGGMEYPQLITAGTRNAAPPSTLRPERVIVHEMGHQWFMNILASNEAEEAWLDEGLTTYFTARVLDAAYGAPIQDHRLLGVPFLVTPLFDFPGFAAGWPEWIGLPDWAHPPQLDILTAWADLPPLTMLRTPRYVDDPLTPRRRSYLRSAGWDEMVRPSWEFRDRRSYGVNAYSRPALFIATLRRRLHAQLGAEAGERAFLEGIHRYTRDWRFRHPRTEDFLASFSDGSGHDVRPLADALIHSTGMLDYAIEEIRSVDEPDLLGRVERDGEIRAITGDGESSTQAARSAVLVRRRGEVIVPVRLQITRQDGPADAVDWETVEWDGRERWKSFEFAGKVVAARLHPHAEYLQDVDRRNDSLVKNPTTRPGLKWGVRFLLWLENAALSYGRFL